MNMIIRNLVIAAALAPLALSADDRRPAPPRLPGDTAQRQPRIRLPFASTPDRTKLDRVIGSVADAVLQVLAPPGYHGRIRFEEHEPVRSR